MAEVNGIHTMVADRSYTLSKTLDAKYPIKTKIYKVGDSEKPLVGEIKGLHSYEFDNSHFG